jgi:hypothetical protein
LFSSPIIGKIRDHPAINWEKIQNHGVVNNFGTWMLISLSFSAILCSRHFNIRTNQKTFFKYALQEEIKFQNARISTI